MNTNTILFVQKKSIYKTLGCNCYDEERNALNFKGGTPAIYHPPCPDWSKCKGQSKFVPGRKWLGIWAMMMVRKHGGILEHPAGSSLFKKMKCNLNGKPDHYGGYIIRVDQRNFGHRAQKKTWLYIVGIRKKDILAEPLRFDNSNYQPVHIMGKHERDATPLQFAEYLINNLNNYDPRYKMEIQSHLCR